MSFINDLMEHEKRLTDAGNKELSIPEISAWYAEFKSLFPPMEEMLNTPLFEVYTEYLYKFKHTFPHFFDPYCDIFEADFLLLQARIGNVDDEEKSQVINAELVNWLDFMNNGIDFLPEIINSEEASFPLSGENHHIGRFLTLFGFLLWENGLLEQAATVFGKMIILDNKNPFDAIKYLEQLKTYPTWTAYCQANLFNSEVEKELDS